jgi:hypothetical protein
MGEAPCIRLPSCAFNRKTKGAKLRDFVLCAVFIVADAFAGKLGYVLVTTNRKGVDAMTYEQTEAAILRRDLERIEKAPLAERREARDDWRKSCLSELDIIAGRVGWLFEGCYGKGAYDEAWRIAESRGNRVAAIGQLIAALEWHCPAAFAREVWRGLTVAERGSVDAAIMGAMDAAKAEREGAE